MMLALSKVALRGFLLFLFYFEMIFAKITHIGVYSNTINIFILAFLASLRLVAGILGMICVLCVGGYDDYKRDVFYIMNTII